MSGGGLYIGAIGMRAQQRALEAIANNVANMNTPAFKRSEVRFSELVSLPAEGTDPLSSLAGVRSEASPRVFVPGDLRQTASAFDVAINGAGLIELMGPGGQTLLWRGGTLKVNTDGQLAAANGMPLKASITVPAQAEGIIIGQDGVVQAMMADEGAIEIGRIDLVMVRDHEGLTPAGDGVYRPHEGADLTTVRSGDEGSGTLVQGALENSNVQLTSEMVSLMLVQRAFAANAQLVQAGDQMMSIINGLKR